MRVVLGNYLVAINSLKSGFIFRRFQIESCSFIRFCVPVSPRRPKETKTTTYDEYENNLISKWYGKITHQLLQLSQNQFIIPSCL